MRYTLTFFSIIFLMTSCSSLDKKKPGTAETITNDWENAPFQGLQTIRVMLSIVTTKVDQEKIRGSLLNEFKKIGEVHTPTDASIEKLLEAQSKPFAILTFDVKEIEISNPLKRMPLLSISARMYEEGTLAINNKDVMSNVWEVVKYIEISSEENTTSLDVIQMMKILLDEFSDKYQKSNLQNAKPVFYIGESL